MMISDHFLNNVKRGLCVICKANPGKIFIIYANTDHAYIFRCKRCLPQYIEPEPVEISMEEFEVRYAMEE